MYVAIATEWGKMQNIIDNLSCAKLFHGLSREILAKIYPLLDARLLHVNKGTILVHPDDTVSFIGLLLSGELVFSEQDIHGQSNLIKKILPYEVFTAEIACTPSQTSPVEIACTADSEVITFPYRLLSAKSAVPDEYRCTILKNILDIMANSNMRQLYKIEILSKKNLRDRIILYLALQAKRSASNSFQISFNREELATYLCVDRSALSRELGKMKREGLIAFKKNSFQILSDLIDILRY